MLKNIGKAFLFHSELGRVEFCVALVAGTVLVKAVAPMIAGLTLYASPIHSAAPLILFWTVLAVVVFPIFAARLKDIGWPPVLAALITGPLLPLTVYQYHLSTSGLHAQRPPAWYLSVSTYLMVATFGFAVLLLAWPSKRAGDN